MCNTIKDVTDLCCPGNWRTFSLIGIESINERNSNIIQSP